MRELIEILIQKSKEGKAVWSGGILNKELSIKLTPEISVAIQVQDDKDNQPEYSVRIYRQYETMRKMTSTDSPQLAGLIKDLYYAATDVYFDLPEKLDDLVEMIKNQDVIGQKNGIRCFKAENNFH